MLFFNKMGFTYLNYKSQYSYQSLKLFVLFRILDPVMNYLLYAAIVSAIVGTDYLTYVIIGNIIFYTGNEIMLNFLSMFRAERHYGTLELNVAAPMPTFIIILRKAAVPIMDGALVFMISLLLGKFLFGISLPSGQWGNLILLFAVTLFSLFCFSLIFASISLVFRNVNLFLNIATSGLQLLCGAYFSVTLFPGWVEMISRLLPLTHAIEAARAIYGLEEGHAGLLMARELANSLCYLVIAILLVGIMERAARRNGSLVKSH